MFVSAPRRTAPGNTTDTLVIACRAGGANYPNFAQALANANVLNQSTSTAGSSTSRASMLNGCAAYKRYINTTYSATYTSRQAQGRVISVLRSGVNHISINNQMYPSSVTGFFGNGVTFNVEADLNNLLNLAIIQNMVNAAKSDALISAKDQKMDVSETLTGLPKTLVMIAERSTQILRAYNAVRKGNLPAAIGNLGLHNVQLRRFRRKDAANIWLELQYGWLPLLSDIYDGFNLVKEFIAPLVPKDQFSVVARREQPLIIRGPNYDTASWNTATASTEGVAKCEVKYRFRVDNPTAHLMSQLEVLNPLYVAWVALPFSFVLDWLVPVGTTLSALSSHIGLQFTTGYVSQVTWGSSSIKASSRKTGVYIKMLETGETSARVERLIMNRTPLASFPIPTFYIQSPFSNKRIVNAIALVDASRKWR